MHFSCKNYIYLHSKGKIMDRRHDPMGRAIAEYHKNGCADKLRVFSPMFDEDEIPLDTLFRGFDDMPGIERKALDMAKGKVLDVGAGSGCHSLVLQERGMDVTAIDISPLAVETMRARGVKQVYEKDFFTVREKYDTVLMMMNGIGIVGNLDGLPRFFRLLDSILAPGGQLLCDSTDIRYVFANKYGSFDFPDTGYYGELTYRMQYKDTVGDEFPWLYVDAAKLKNAAKQHGYAVEVVLEGGFYDYLARITKIES